jgi:hypothetical protein
MSEGLPITNQPAARPAPEVQIPESPNNNDAYMTKDQVQLLEPQMRDLAAANMNMYIEAAFKGMNLPKTEENYNRIAVNLSKKIEQWLASGEGLTDDVTPQEYSKHFMDLACARMGLDSNTKNWAKIMKIMGMVR